MTHTFEYLELLASAHAPPSGAVLWEHTGKPRLTRDKGLPFTQDEHADILNNLPPTKEGDTPEGIDAVIHPEKVTRRPGFSYNQLVCNLYAAGEDAVDAPLPSSRRKQ